jgi:transcriptional antiterminator NusG
MSTEKKLDFKWYVLRTISGKEKKIKDYILQEVAGVGAAEKIPQVVIPVEKRLQIRNGKKVVVESNMMPGYMLLEGKLDPDLISIIRNVPNVIDFLGKENPTPLRESEAKRMLGIVDELTDAAAFATVPFIIGESVKVVDGPFNDFTGVIDEVNEDKKKLRVMVKIFGRKTPLDLNYNQVERIS